MKTLEIVTCKKCDDCGDIVLYVKDSTLLTSDSHYLPVASWEKEVTTLGKYDYTVTYDENLLVDPSKPLRACDVTICCIDCSVQYVLNQIGNSLELSDFNFIAGRIYEEEETGNPIDYSDIKILPLEENILKKNFYIKNRVDDEAPAGYIPLDEGVVVLPSNAPIGTEISIFNYSAFGSDPMGPQFSIQIYAFFTTVPGDGSDVILNPTSGLSVDFLDFSEKAKFVKISATEWLYISI